MKKLTTLLIILFLVSISVEAQVVKLSNKSYEIFETEINGTPKEGVSKCFSIELPAYKNAMFYACARGEFDNVNRLYAWPTTDLGNLFSKNWEYVPAVGQSSKTGTLLVLELENGSYMMIQPLATESTMSWVEIKSSKEVNVVCGSMGTSKLSLENEPVFAYGVNSDLYKLYSDVWSEILDHKKIKGNTNYRVNKSYPETFEYLGWCSWEHFFKNINEELLCKAIDDIESSDIPVRWVLIDDGHQTANKKSLISLTPDAKKFPNGWAPLINKKSEKIKWMGLWHCMYGLWDGFDKNHTISELTPYIVKSNRTNRLVINGDRESSNLFYDMFVGTVSNPGFNFTKIDVQTHAFENYIGSENAVARYHQTTMDLERYAKKRLNGLMNCMAQNIPCAFNTKYSATTRVSQDYKLNDIPKARNHIYQGFQNTSWMAQTVWPDHDMFHSSDAKLGRFMAVSKAISAAPIYLSDYPTNFVAEYINPLCYKDGKLLRPLAPGAPLPKSYFVDALMGDKDYQVIAPLTSKSAVIVAYHLSNKYDGVIKASVSSDDYSYADIMVQPYPGKRAIPQEGLVYYDWYESKGGKLDGNYYFELKNIEDRMIQLSEIENGWSIIGNKDKYLSALAVKESKINDSMISFSSLEEGDVLVYSKTPITKAINASFSNVKDNIYLVTPININKKVTLYK